MATKILVSLATRDKVSVDLGPSIVHLVRAGYSKANDQVASHPVHPALEPMSFGYNRYTQVQNEMLRLPDLVPGAEARIVPDSNRSWYHVEVQYDGLLVTVEHAQHQTSRPKWARYKNDLSGAQSSWDVIGGSFVPQIPLPTPKPLVNGYVYVHILHGKAWGKELGFIMAVFETSLGAGHNPVWLYRYDDQMPVSDDVNNVNPNFRF